MEETAEITEETTQGKLPSELLKIFILVYPTLNQDLFYNISNKKKPSCRQGRSNRNGRRKTRGSEQ